MQALGIAVAEETKKIVLREKIRRLEINLPNYEKMLQLMKDEIEESKLKLIRMGERV